MDQIEKMNRVENWKKNEKIEKMDKIEKWTKVVFKIVLKIGL